MREISLKEAIALGFGSRSTILRRVADGTLHPTQVKNRYYFDIDELRDKLPNYKGPVDSGYVDLVIAAVDQAPRLTDSQRRDLLAILGGE